MDMIPEGEKTTVFQKFFKEIEESTKDMAINKVFATSIWDESLYKAWSTIVQFLIPNLGFIQQSLKKFCHICDCDEIVLFEKATFLIIAYHEHKKHADAQRYEKLSNIVK